MQTNLAVEQSKTLNGPRVRGISPVVTFNGVKTADARYLCGG